MAKLSEVEGGAPAGGSTFVETLKPTTKATRLSEIPEEPGLEPVGLLESFITPVKALPAVWGAAEVAKRYAVPKAAQFAEKMLPKTGREMLEQIGLAGTAGVTGELASRSVPEEYKEFKPTARLFGELATPGAAFLTRGVGRGPSPLIPKERLESSQYLTEKMREGGNVLKGPSYAQLKEGPAGTASLARQEAQQGTTNRILNETFELPQSNIFGRDQFNMAKNNLSGKYDQILTGQTVKFDPKFFDDLGKLLEEETGLAGTGISFGQSKAILNSLSKITGLPEQFRARINAISGLPEDQVSPQQAEMALATVKDLIPVLRNAPEIVMDARNYNTIRSILGDAATRTSIDRSARVLRKMQNAFDDQADKSLPPATSKALGQVRRQWEALKTAEEAQLMADQPGIVTAYDIGRAIEKRIQEGSIYGSNNPLYKVGQTGLTLTGRGGKSLDVKAAGARTPTSLKTGALLDVLSRVTQPFTLYPKLRLQSPVPTAQSYAAPTAAPVVTAPRQQEGK